MQQDKYMLFVKELRKHLSANEWQQILVIMRDGDNDVSSLLRVKRVVGELLWYNVMRDVEDELAATALLSMRAPCN